MRPSVDHVSVRRSIENVLKNSLITVGCLVFWQQSLAAAPPSAGSQLQQIPPALAPDRATPQLRIEAGKVPSDTPVDSATVKIDSLHVIDAKVFPEAQLIATTGFRPGDELTLSALRECAAKITNFYRGKGYFLAQAYLPAQDIVDGSVTIAVVEGQYGKVVLRNQSRLSDGLALQWLDGLNSGDTITIAPLESRLLQLSDLPGVNVKSTLVPGASVGASDLIVEVTEPRPRLPCRTRTAASGSTPSNIFSFLNTAP